MTIPKKDKMEIEKKFDNEYESPKDKRRLVNGVTTSATIRNLTKPPITLGDTTILISSQRNKRSVDYKSTGFWDRELSYGAMMVSIPNQLKLVSGGRN